MGRFTSLDICAGAGGQALGLERAGFDPIMLIDDDADACATLRANRPHWDVRLLDLFDFVGHEHPQVLDVDLLAGGPPRLQYSVAGKRREPATDGQDPIKAAVWLATEVRPRALMLENVPALVTDDRFAETRNFVEDELGANGYTCEWTVLDAQDHGVPQRRKHGIVVAMRPAEMSAFRWPPPVGGAATVGDVLGPSMASRGWPGAAEWRKRADEVAPTIVGGSKLRGGADLGPSRTKSIWERLGVNGGSIGDEPPDVDFPHAADGVVLERKDMPRLTVEQVALLQGFPSDWTITGRKTARYRQVGHALPPPLATAIGRRIAQALGSVE